MRKILITSIFIGLFLILIPFNVLGLVEPTSNFYINDYANVLDDEVENYIMSRSVDLANKTSAQIVVVTIDTLNGENLEEYATKLFRSFGIGDSKKNNGLLLLLVVNDRKFRVEVGYGLEGVLPDGLTGRYQDEYIIPYLKNNDWNNGVKNGYTAFYTKLCDYYEVDALSNTDSVVTVGGNDTNDPIDTLVFVIASALVGPSFILGLYFRYASKAKKKKISFISVMLCLGDIIFIFIMSFLYGSMWFVFLFLQIIAFLIARFCSFDSTYSSRGGYYGGGGSSGGGFSSGGGSSGGGGSSRGF